MADPQTETQGTTHTYVAIVWYKDWQTWFNILSAAALLLQEKDILIAIPERYHATITALVIGINVILRVVMTTRPVAMTSGTTREVASIAPKPPPSAGSVSTSTRLGLAVLLAFSLSDCAKPPPNLTPEATAAFHGTRVVKALDLVRDFAIDAEAQTPQVLSTANTRIVVDFHEMAVRTIHAVPSGWKPTVTAALNALSDKLGADYAKLAPYVNLVKTLIASIP